MAIRAPDGANNSIDDGTDKSNGDDEGSTLAMLYHLLTQVLAMGKYLEHYI